MGGGGHGVAITGRGAAQVVVRPLVVVLAAEAMEGALLSRERAAGRADGARLERFVHALVGSVVLGGGGSGALVLDAQPHPPDVELREAVNAGGGKGHTVVGADRVRQAMGTKDLHEAGPYTKAFRGQQALAG